MTKDELKELSVKEVLGFTLAFLVTCSFIVFLTVLTYGMAKQFNLI